VKARYHRNARKELTAAAEWYEPSRSGPGRDFVNEVTRAVALILEHPSAWPQWQGIKTQRSARELVLQERSRT
jgi:hypothetical protein